MVLADMGDFAGWAGAAAAIVIAGVGGFFKLLHNIGNRFTLVTDKIDTKTREVVDRVTEIYDAHEKRDQGRHEENVQRLTRLETLANGNSYSGKRRN